MSAKLQIGDNKQHDRICIIWTPRYDKLSFSRNGRSPETGSRVYLAQVKLGNL